MAIILPVGTKQCLPWHPSILGGTNVPAPQGEGSSQQPTPAISGLFYFLKGHFYYFFFQKEDSPIIYIAKHRQDLQTCPQPC